MINKINNKIIRIFNSRLIKIGISLQNTIFDRDVFNNDQIYIDEIDIKKQFSHIFSNNIWGSQESVSGPGSEVVRTEKYRQNLLKLLHKYKLYKIFDAPCGDFNWMKKFLEENNNTFEYLGGDIVSELIDSNIKNYPSYNFLEIDLTSDKFPKADIFHCRDLLFHLSYDNIYKILVNFINSEILTPARLMISVGGIVQQPDLSGQKGYNISGGTDRTTDPLKIDFAEAPKFGEAFFGVAYGLTIEKQDAYITYNDSLVNSIVFGV